MVDTEKLNERKTEMTGMKLYKIVKNENGAVVGHIYYDTKDEKMCAVDANYNIVVYGKEEALEKMLLG